MASNPQDAAGVLVRNNERVHYQPNAHPGDRWMVTRDGEPRLWAESLYVIAQRLNLDIEEFNRCAALMGPTPAAGETGAREAPLNALAVEVNAINRGNGWNVLRPDEWDMDKYHIPAVLALIHSEVSEALEAFRERDRENFAEEIADTIIRCLDCAGGLGIDIDREIAAKLAKNRTRGLHHGGKRV